MLLEKSVPIITAAKMQRRRKRSMQQKYKRSK
jgi:hypothetical protein